jgi:hypothetical protein
MDGNQAAKLTPLIDEDEHLTAGNQRSHVSHEMVYTHRDLVV